MLGRKPADDHDGDDDDDEEEQVEKICQRGSMFDVDDGDYKYDGNDEY